MKTKKIVNKRNYVPYEGISNDQVSLTIPDQSMTVRTMLERHSRGLSIQGVKSAPVFEGEDSLNVDLKHMDLAEREDLINARKEQLNELKTKIAADKAAKEFAAKQRREKKEVRKEERSDDDHTSTGSAGNEAAK